MCSILKLLPKTTRIFLSTSKANFKAIAAYQSAGFSIYDEAYYGLGFEYLTESSSVLQNFAERLQDR